VKTSHPRKLEPVINPIEKDKIKFNELLVYLLLIPSYSLVKRNPYAKRDRTFIVIIIRFPHYRPIIYPDEKKRMKPFLENTC
jgi:hypothetical protein